ncbi:MAG: hypothetical protein E7504_00335 [Ruminococcus sp.]|nr:hypothetical protein [Ruminococcus sp.]
MPQTKTKPNQQQRKLRLSPRAALAIFVVIIIIVAAAIITIKVGQWKNDGARYARTLSEQIGVSPETAQKYARMTLENSSAHACVNMATENYEYMYESKKTVQVSGVTIPQWLILAGTSNNVITDVTYYDYRQLKKYGNGVETDAHVKHEGINTSMDPTAVQKYIGFPPLCTKYTTDSLVESYKYFYEDKNTGDTVSYTLHVTYKDGKAASAVEEENYFILSVLTMD